MAITIGQYASNLTMANSDLIWAVTSNSSSRDQYQFICALKDGCGTTLTTIKQQPNPSAVGVFDLGRIVKQYLAYNPNNFQLTASVFGANNAVGLPMAAFFQVAFGEEYGTSPTSTTSVYNGITNATTGSPAQTGSVPNYFFIDGVLDPNYGSWSWDTGSNYIPRPSPFTGSFSYNVCLTDASRTQYARNDDFMSISTINGNINSPYTTSQDIYAMYIQVYNATGSLISSSTYYNTGNGCGPRSVESQVWANVNGLNTCNTDIDNDFQTRSTLILTAGMGPRNITNAGNINLDTLPWDYYTIKLVGQQEAEIANTNAIWDKFTIYKATGDCEYNGVRFAWINDYGVYDWYTFTLADAKSTTMDRGIFQQNFVNYSTTTATVPYDIKRRGNNAYYTNINEQFTANSNWLTQEEADWLDGLFYSPNVYIQDGNNMLPVIITSNAFTSRTNPRTQKNFQYAITYTLANNKRSR